MTSDWKAYLPGETEPTDLIGYVDYVTVSVGIGAPVQCADYFLFDDPKTGYRTEIGPTR